MKVAVIGCGSIGERHALNLEGLGHTVDRFDPVRFPGKNPYDVISTCDAVVIAAPTCMHDDYMEEAVRYRKPFFVEKPIADNLLGSVVEDAKKAVMCGYNLRFHGCVKKALWWIDSGKIGDPLWANFTLGQFSEKPPYLRDGVILNWSHEIDLATYLLGPATVTGSSTLLRDGKDTMSDILLTHKGCGCRSTIHLDYISDPEVRRFRIQGTLGIIEVDLVRFTADLYCMEPTEPFRWKDHTWNDTYIDEMQAFLDRIDGEKTLGCTGEQGLEVLKICLEVRKQAGLE